MKYCVYSHNPNQLGEFCGFLEQLRHIVFSRTTYPQLFRRLLAFCEPQVVFVAYSSAPVQEPLTKTSDPDPNNHLNLQAIILSRNPIVQARLKDLLGHLKFPAVSTATSVSELWQLILEYSPLLVYFSLDEKTCTPSSISLVQDLNLNLNLSQAKEPSLSMLICC